MFGSSLATMHRVARAAVPLVALFALLAVSGAQAIDILGDLKREAESALRRKAQQATKEAPAPQPSTPAPAAAAGAGVNPYLSHPLSGHPAYVLANQLADAKSEQEVAELMRAAFDKINLGIYTHEGRQLLAGAERKPTDFFLYDFQWKMLARAFYQRNSMSFAGHSGMLGVALLELEDPAPLVGALPRAIERRYRKAVQKPDEPMSFLILLVDGLARQQSVPYSLEETARFADARVRVDPLQSALVMLDFFTRPPAKRSKLGLDWMPSLVSTAHAASPCDMIQGDDEQGYWGRGTDILTEIGQEIPGLAGKAIGVIGNATGITGAIGDLLVLYGMNIKLEPQPNLIHLLHPGEGHVAGIQATVTFDSQGVPDSVLKCGWLIGKSMPSNGGIKDVELTWNFYPDLPPRLEMHSEMWYGYGDRRNILTGTGGGLRTTTDAEGMSTFLIQPKDCPYPRGGPIRGQNYRATVDARFVTKSIPTPGLLGFGLILKLGPGALEYLMHGRSAYTTFRAEWHDKPPDRPQYGGGNQPPG